MEQLPWLDNASLLSYSQNTSILTWETFKSSEYNYDNFMIMYSKAIIKVKKHNYDRNRLSYLHPTSDRYTAKSLLPSWWCATIINPNLPLRINFKILIYFANTNIIPKCAEFKSDFEYVKNAYRMFLAPEIRGYLFLLKKIPKPTYACCILNRRYTV